MEKSTFWIFTDALTDKNTANKDHLNMNFQFTLRVTVLESILPPIPIYLDFIKLLIWPWKLVISVYCIQKLMQAIELHKLLVFVMKYFMLSPLSSNIHQTLRHLVFASHTNELILNAKYPKSSNQLQTLVRNVVAMMYFVKLARCYKIQTTFVLSPTCVIGIPYM